MGDLLEHHVWYAQSQECLEEDSDWHCLMYLYNSPEGMQKSTVSVVLFC